MGFTNPQIDRLNELCGEIEERKENAPRFHACTYRDTPALREMVEIVEGAMDDNPKTLESAATVLRYIAMCYYELGRAGVSAYVYRSLMEIHRLRGLTGKDLEDDFYYAVKARNFYEPDPCDDLVGIVSGLMEHEKIQELMEKARRSIHIKNDPVEKTEKYLVVIDEVERRIDERKETDSCHEFWRLKREILEEMGITWRSPAVLNPRIRFD